MPIADLHQLADDVIEVWSPQTYLIIVNVLSRYPNFDQETIVNLDLEKVATARRHSLTTYDCLEVSCFLYSYLAGSKVLIQVLQWQIFVHLRLLVVNALFKVIVKALDLTHRIIAVLLLQGYAFRLGVGLFFKLNLG